MSRAPAGTAVGGPVLIMAGGTGGAHFFPALAVAHVLEQAAASPWFWLGVPGSMEARRLVPKKRLSRSSGCALPAFAARAPRPGRWRRFAC